MVLGSHMQGATTANGTGAQGSRLSQMQDSFRKQMLRDKEKAKVTPTATRTTPAAPPQRVTNGTTAPPRATNGSITATRAANPTPKTAKPAEEERKPLRQTQRPATTPRPKAQDEVSPKKVVSATPPKSNNIAARPRPTAKPASTPTAPVQQTRTPASMKKTAPGSAATSDLPECRHCGRRFAQDRLTVHEGICLKTTRKKRKVFDPTKMRVKGTEAESYLRHQGRTSKVPPGPPKSDWRRKHEEFIRSIRDAKTAQAHVAAGGKLSDLPPPPPMDTSHLIPCPHCGRKFNDSAAERHIPRCKDIINKPKPPPTARAGPSGAVAKGKGQRR